MRRRFGEWLLGAVVLLAVIVVTVATATDYTVSISGIDEKILDKLKDVENASRASQGLAPLTTSEYMSWATTEALHFKWLRVRPRLIGLKSEADKNAFVGVTP
ncbi:MAG: hypothetical protein AMS21_00725 [Gemmatimonas sp. SG8_38_2]|nr:MAG: hypothetical protein AMS21_00725 [Gemmatimonas sp. SG8_38_2]